MAKNCRMCYDKNCDTCINHSEGTYIIIQTSGNHIYPTRQLCRKERARRERKRYENLFKFSQIPYCYEGKTFSDYLVDASNSIGVQTAKTMIDGKTNGLYIFGGVGTGKTFLASIVAQSCMMKGRTVIFASVPDLLTDLKATFDSKNNGNSTEMIKDLVNCDLLIMDDIGTEYLTAWASEQLFLIINGRLNNRKQIIFTSNYNLDNLANRLIPRDKYGKPIDSMQGERLVSRIYQLCEIVPLNGEDRRRKRKTA